MKCSSIELRIGIEYINSIELWIGIEYINSIELGIGMGNEKLQFRIIRNGDGNVNH